MRETETLLQSERKAIFALCFVYGLRMLGLFFIMPVIVYDLQENDPLNVGLKAGFVIGAYGITQAIFQIPFGILSDFFGRKRVIVAGLLLFSLGSFFAAVSTNTTELIVARLVQGMGAISSVVTAFLADLTRPKIRTKAMAFVGLSIGIAFILALVISPITYSFVGLNGLFFIVGLLGIFAVLVVLGIKETKSFVRTKIVESYNLRNFSFQLIILFCSIFILMTIQAALFIVIPLYFLDFGYQIQDHWKIYLPVLCFAFLGIIWPVKKITRDGRQRLFFIFSIFLLILSIWSFGQFSENKGIFLLSLVLYFLGFNLLEAILPSWVSMLSALESRGFSLAIYNTFQAMGIFFGGTIGGLLFEKYGFDGIIYLCLILSFFWIIISLRLKKDG
ncbi:MAG: MFS transporter [Burkholderiaceae bacterium]|nr:MAG: MFS transporter [Burkholderiaceae bacterium]